MKKVLLFLAFAIMSTTTYAVNSVSWAKQFQDDSAIQNLNPNMKGLVLSDFLDMTPKKYKKMTGEKLGWKNTLKMKAAQKMLKKKMKKGGNEPLDKTLYIVLAIIGLGFIGMGVASDWDGNEWIIGLVLAFLCWIPGVIYSLVKMKNYY